MKSHRIVQTGCMLGVALLAACTDAPTTTALASADPAPDLSAAGDHVPTYSQERLGTFVDATDEELWKHIEYSERTGVVGLRRPGANRGVYRGRVLMDRSQWENSRRAAASQPGVELIWADTLLPTIKVRFRDFEAFQKVRRLPGTDFIEPLRAVGDIPPLAEGSLGCNNQGEWGEERLYTNGTSGDVYSLKHRSMGIEHAWLRTSGAGVTIGVVDTGIHSGQAQLLPSASGGRFSSGESAGRWVKYRTAWSGNVDASPLDNCGHGTEAAGVAVAPRDGLGPVGVAWKSNLVATRIANGVVNVNADDAGQGIRNTVAAMAGQPGGKVITMSWQSLNWYWQVSNEIEYWQSQHPNNLLFFAAAGTSTDDWKECGIAATVGFGVGSLFHPFVGLFALWAGCIEANNGNVVFPASHSNVVAVTCVDYHSKEVSNNCHYGSKVEFAAYQSFPTVHGSSPLVDRLGGSSGASPTVAAQAALIWSYYPQFTRAQVLDRMRWAGRASRDSRQGYGVVNTYKAVGGMYSPAIASILLSGGGFNQVANYRLQPMIHGGTGPFSYLWDNGATTQTIQVAVGPGDPHHIYHLWVTDHSDGGKVRARVEISPPPGGCEDPTKFICES
ncbi:S8/S53 family peptidase [Longimicrobium sp.]|uniref:S8/S53 family peptidase n=1 Tax=Longimicrobium sp. TaxID=2029185 RepID=UPI003B3A9057